MVRLITNYNRILNEKVFVLKGEEDYARTTETLLEMLEFSDTYSDLSKYRLGFKIDVLRDKGDSSYVTLYDRDEVLGVFDWNQSMGDGLVIGKEGGASSTNPLNHGYDMNYSMEHDFYVKFSGNKKCLPSQSSHISKYVEATNETRIDWLVNPESTTDEGTLTVDIGLICGDLTLTRDKPIKWYIDDVYDGTSDTNEESVAEYTFTNIEGGHHTIKAVFEGDSTLLASENSYETRSGYKLTFQDIPTRYVMGQSVPIKVKVTDYDGNAVPYAEVGLYDEYNDPLDVSGIADENGIVSLVLEVNTPFKAKYGNYESIVFRPNWVSPSDIEIDLINSDYYAPSSIYIVLSDMYGVGFDGLLVPVTVQSVAGSTTTNYITDYNGLIRISFDKEYVGDTTVSVNIGGISKSVMFEDNVIYISDARGKHGALNQEIYQNIQQLANHGAFYFNVGENSYQLPTYLNKMTDCQLYMTIHNEPMTINLKAPNGDLYPISVVKYNGLRITPNASNTGFDVDIGSKVGENGESWRRAYTNIPLYMGGRYATYNYFTIETSQRLLFNELNIKRIK